MVVRGCELVVCLGFAVFGAIALYLLTIRPLWGVACARFWTEVPCSIVSSDVGTHRFSTGKRHSIEIEYDYVFKGRPHRGDRYHFLDWATSGRGAKQAVVDRYPAGLRTTCFVDPSEPSQSVLHRGLTLGMLWAMFPFPFLAVGVWGLLDTFAGRPVFFATTSDSRSPLTPDG